MLAVLLFYFFIAGGQPKAHFRNQEALSSKKTELVRVQESIAEKKKEYMRWIEARQDVRYLIDNFFYHGRTSIYHIRQDLNELYRNTGIKASNIKYNYEENEDGKFKKISVSFDIAGTYALIKKFLFEIENIDKFMYVEKITFKDIEREGGKVQLGLSLAVYYEA